MDRIFRRPFLWPGAIPQDREGCQFPFVLDEKPTFVPGGSAGERSGGARKISCGVARYDRLINSARTIKTSPYLEEKIVLAVHSGLRRGSLFKLKWEHVDLGNRVMRIPRTKNGRPLSLPLNATALGKRRLIKSENNRPAGPAPTTLIRTFQSSVRSQWAKS